MKKNAVLLYGLFSAFMLIFLTGCSDKIENISDMNGNVFLLAHCPLLIIIGIMGKKSE